MLSLAPLCDLVHAAPAPGGIGSSGMGYLAFVVVKLFGYCAFAAVAQKWLGRPRWPVLVVGTVRTLVGMLVGLGVFLLVRLADGVGAGAAEDAATASQAPAEGGNPVWFLIGLLIAVRVGEWQFVLRLAYREAKRARIHALTAAGIVWSFVLDAIAVAAAFAVPGGFWVC